MVKTFYRIRINAIYKGEDIKLYVRCSSPNSTPMYSDDPFSATEENQLSCAIDLWERFGGVVEEVIREGPDLNEVSSRVVYP